jgi:hypothetical protein
MDRDVGVDSEITFLHIPIARPNPSEKTLQLADERARLFG